MKDKIIEPIENKTDEFDTFIAKAVNKKEAHTPIEKIDKSLEIISNSEKDFIVYASDDGNINVRVLIDKENETIWLNQKQLATLFDVTPQNITTHLRNIFETQELEEISTCKEILQVQIEGNRKIKRNTKHYNLDVIISLGFRINSYKATKFRIWARETLKEYTIKGFVLDDDRLKQGENLFDKDYFDELLERIRDIRASEKRVYRKIIEIYHICSADYDPNSPITRTFYAHAQNKLEFAVIGMTAAEIIKERANYKLPHMGLTTWKQQKTEGKIYTYDVVVAKNYMTEEEISNLNLLVDQFLDFAEGLARRKVVMYMKDWAEKLNDFLKLNEYEVLQNFGKVSADIAKNFAIEQFNLYKPTQEKNHKTEFDKFVEKTKRRKRKKL